MPDTRLPPSSNGLFAAHPRSFAENRYVYPVLSRRAGGISIGVNLSLDKQCTFDCVYCQVDRRGPAAQRQLVDLGQLAEELSETVQLVTSGRLFEGERFRHTPAPLRRLNDIALSGDGEPTLYPNFDEVVLTCAEVRRRHRLDDVKLVLITNASTLQDQRVARALETLDANNGEIWAKLDAGTEAYYRQVSRSAAPWERILDNLRRAALVRPIVIQSLFMRIYEQPPPREEIDAYCERLREIVAAGGRIKLVQIHTVARVPAESWVTPLRPEEIDALAELVRRRTGLPAVGYRS